MAFRTWVKLSAATLGVAALAGASQLGLAYGLGILRLTRVLDVTTRDQWTAQLAWVAWIPMLAAVIGALTGAVLLRRWFPESGVPGVGTELALAFSAAIGAGVVVPLTMQPARTAQVAGVSPVVVIAICAGLGALVGVFAAWAALAQAFARWSLITMGAAVWVIALVSVAPSLAPSDPLPAIRLGVFDAGFLSPAVTQRTALATMPALALVIGALLGWAARRRELPTLTIALAGLPGPALLTIAYLIAGPGAGDDRYQVVPYWAAMTATGAGVLGSVLAAVLRRGPEPGDDDERDGTASEKPPLPKRTNQPDSAIAAAGAVSAGASPAAGSGPAADPQPRPVDTGVFDLPQRDRSTDTPPGPAGAGAGLGGPPPADAKPAKPRRRGRRSSVADAFISRTGEFPAAQPGGAPATPAGGNTAEFPPARPTDDFPSSRSGGSADFSGSQSGGPADFPPSRSGGSGDFSDPRSGGPVDFPESRAGDFAGTRSGPAADLASGRPRGAAAPFDPPHREPAPFDAFERGNQDERPRSGGAPWSPAAPQQDTWSEPKPYVPEPATRPLPPGVGTATPEPERAPGAGGRLGRGLRPFGRGKSAEPLTPEPTPISAPLPHPDPVTPPLAVTPAPRTEPAPSPVTDGPDGKRRPKNGKDEDYVDWVSGLGK
jgi:hypothetical protein